MCYSEVTGKLGKPKMVWNLSRVVGTCSLWGRDIATVLPYKSTR
jgi:hypothetical protein